MSFVTGCPLSDGEVLQMDCTNALAKKEPPPTPPTEEEIYKTCTFIFQQLQQEESSSHKIAYERLKEFVILHGPHFEIIECANKMVDIWLKNIWLKNISCSMWEKTPIFILYTAHRFLRTPNDADRLSMIYKTDVLIQKLKTIPITGKQTSCKDFLLSKICKINSDVTMALCNETFKKTKILPENPNNTTKETLNINFLCSGNTVLPSNSVSCWQDGKPKQHHRFFSVF